MIKYSEEDFKSIEIDICTCKSNISNAYCATEKCDECVKNYLEQHLEYLKDKNGKNQIN